MFDLKSLKNKIFIVEYCLYKILECNDKEITVFYNLDRQDTVEVEFIKERVEYYIANGDWLILGRIGELLYV